MFWSNWFVVIFLWSLLVKMCFSNFFLVLIIKIMRRHGKSYKTNIVFEEKSGLFIIGNKVRIKLLEIMII